MAFNKKVRWRKADMLGQGAFCSVYLGLNMDTGELMAVKEVIISQKKSQVENVVREVELLSRLDHKHIVKYLGTELSEDGVLDIFMEFVPGGSLELLVSKFGNFPEDLARHYTRQILLGLAYLHEQKVIHRDIKGANVLISNEGTVKLADFGTSRDVAALAGDAVMATVTGTPLWMAPEVVLERGYCNKADVYSLGATVVEILTGKPPNSSIHNFAALVRHWDKGMAIELPDELSSQAKDFLGHCLCIDPDERWSAAQLLEHPFANVDDKGGPYNLTAEELRDLSNGIADAKKMAEEAERTPAVHHSVFSQTSSGSGSAGGTFTKAEGAGNGPDDDTAAAPPILDLPGDGAESAVPPTPSTVPVEPSLRSPSPTTEDADELSTALAPSKGAAEGRGGSGGNNTSSVPPLTFVVASSDNHLRAVTAGLLRVALGKRGGAFEICEVASGGEAVERLGRPSPVHVLIIDEDFPPIPGQQFKCTMSALGLAVHSASAPGRNPPPHLVFLSHAPPVRLPTMFRRLLGSVPAWHKPATADDVEKFLSG